jgi:hypothetical protein
VSIDADQVMTWIAGYEEAWRTPGTQALGRLFTPGATYQQGPYDEPVIGLPAIARRWEAEREGSGEVFAMTSAIVAVDGDTAVVRVEVNYGTPVFQEYRDLWIITFAEDGRCAAFEEWPFWPEQALVAEVG